MNKSAEIVDILSHMPTQVCEEIKKYVSDTVMIRSRYLFVRREKKQQFGFCTHCRNERPYFGHKHGEIVECSNCLSSCVVKSSGRGRKYLIDDGYFVWFAKSIKDPNAITARGIYVQRNYSGSYEEVETVFVDTAAYVFEQGQARMMNRSYWWPNDSWQLRRSIFAESDGIMATKACFLSVESIKAAVADTPFQYSTWERYDASKSLQFFDLAAKYNCIEYLTKFGLSSFVLARLHGLRTFSAINWRGKTLDKVLKVTKHELKEIRDAESHIEPFTLWLHHQAKKDGSKFSIQDSLDFSSSIEGDFGFEVLQEIRRHTPIGKIRNYMKRQLAKGTPGHYQTGRQVLIAWRDYLSDCIDLEMNIADESILFTGYLYQAHQTMIERKKVIADEALNLKIKKRLASLKSYEFRKGGLFIRSAKDSAELVEEGNALKHCVGSYARNYAEGKTDLLVIRKEDEPDIPFYTVEVRDNRISQAYGFKNCHPTESVQSFIEAFEAAKLKIVKRESVAV